MSLLWRATRHVVTKLLLLYSKHFDIVIHLYRCLLLHVVVRIVCLGIVIYWISLFSTCKASSLVVGFEIWFTTSWILVIIFWYVNSLNFLWRAWLLLIIHIHLNSSRFDNNLILVRISIFILLLFSRKYIIPNLRMPMLPPLWLWCRLLLTRNLLLLTTTASLRNNDRFIMLFFRYLLEPLIRISFLLFLLFVIIILTFG